MKIPAVKVASAQIEFAELSGSVIVGEESAKLLTKKLGREVKPGEVFDLGVLAVYHKNSIKTFLSNFRLFFKKNIFS